MFNLQIILKLLYMFWKNILQIKITQNCQNPMYFNIFERKAIKLFGLKIYFSKIYLLFYEVILNM